MCAVRVVQTATESALVEQRRALWSLNQALTRTYSRSAVVVFGLGPT